jgi:hypothetical protein
MGKKQLVLSFFESEAAADAAVASLKAWDKASEEIKLGAIGVMALDEKGKLKTHKLGARSMAQGAGIGLILALIMPITLLTGIVGGAIVGALHHKGLSMKKEDRERIAGELEGGKAAVGVLAKPEEAAAVAVKLAELGGTSETHELSEADVAEADQAAVAEASSGETVAVAMATDTEPTL